MKRKATDGPDLPPLKLMLPGVGLPLNSVDGWKAQASSYGYVTNVMLPDSRTTALFPSALHPKDIEYTKAALQLTPVREFVMLRVMNSITDKPGWENKVFNTDITAKWKEEIMGNEAIDFTVEMWDWVVAELQFKTEGFKKTGMLKAYDAGVVKSDTAIPESLKNELKAAVASLENVPEEEKDYHPHSNDQVLDLVHPSLFPVVYGRTRIVTDGILGIQDGLAKAGTGELLPVPPKTTTKHSGIWTSPFHPSSVLLQYPYSQKFQWLPCDVEFTSSSPVDDQANSNTNPSHALNQCKITSYINNLHPTSHATLYGIIERVISLALPLWNMTLTTLEERSDYYRIDCSEVTFRKEMPRPGSANNWQQPSPRSDMVMPPEEVLVDLKRDYAETGLQVIVKLANIHLTPGKPQYNGGSWHVEGQLNEHICATALYYYDSANITDSRLAFRQMSNPEDARNINYPNDEYTWTQSIFGVRVDGPIVQDIGDIACTEGRLLTFPNVLQHRVAPFALADPSKPGHRKILALFLVDPNIHIISSSHVPVQRRDWFEEMVSMDQVLGGLPRELGDEIEGYLEKEGWMMGMEEAKRLRLELMEERKVVDAERVKGLKDKFSQSAKHFPRQNQFSGLAPNGRSTKATALRQSRRELLERDFETHQASTGAEFPSSNTAAWDENHEQLPRQPLNQSVRPHSFSKYFHHAAPKIYFEVGAGPQTLAEDEEMPDADMPSTPNDPDVEEKKEEEEEEDEAAATPAETEPQAEQQTEHQEEKQEEQQAEQQEEQQAEEVSTPAQESESRPDTPVRTGGRVSAIPRKRGRIGRPPKIKPPDWDAPDDAAGEARSDVSTPVKRRGRGRPSAGGRWGRGKGGPSHVTQVPIDKEGNMLDVINDEVDLPEDPEGEKKVDKMGNLLEGREYRVRTFTILNKGERLYMLSTEPARCIGFRDSYLFFQKHKLLFKIIIDDEQKRDLIERDLIPHSYKGRAIGVVTARSVFREFGAKIIIGGRKVIDDYSAQAARERGDVEGELAVPEDKLPGPGETYDKNRYVAWHGASSVYHSGVPSVPMPIGKVVDTKKRKVTVTGDNWMIEHAREASRFNSLTVSARRQNLDGQYDIHTNTMQYPKIMQPTHVRWEAIPPPDSTRADRSHLISSASTTALGITNGTPSSSADDNPQTPKDDSAQTQDDDSKPAATIFSSVPAIFSRTFNIHDIHYETPPESSLGVPGTDGDVHDIGSNGLISIAAGNSNPMFHVSPEILAELPPECQVAYREAAIREWEWKSRWRGEKADGLRAPLKLNYSWNP
ncbi:hypothetical protein FQN55_003623 [Onygenales sp. PD_40]|nr:hypothetical protein FQN55_003623 [Onygenales sp. PD_40]